MGSRKATYYWVDSYREVPEQVASNTEKSLKSASDCSNKVVECTQERERRITAVRGRME